LIPFRVKKSCVIMHKIYIGGPNHLHIKPYINLFKNFKNTFLNIFTLNLWKFFIFIRVYQFSTLGLHYTFYINRVIFSTFRYTFKNEFKLTTLNFIILYARILIFFYHFYLIFICFSLFPPLFFIFLFLN